MAEPFIKLYRKMLDWEWYDDVNTCRVFFHCLLKANWKETRWHGIEIQPGQFITSLSTLSEETKLTVRQVRVALDHLIMTGEVTSKGHSKFRVITVNNWGCYQGNDKVADKQVTDRRQASDKQVTTDKEYKEYKELKNNKKSRGFVKPTVEEVRAYCQERNNTVDAQRFVDFYEMKGWMIGKNHMKDWKAAVRTWEGRRKEESNGSVGTILADDEEQRNREIDEYIRREQAGEFDHDDDGLWD